VLLLAAIIEDSRERIEPRKGLMITSTEDLRLNEHDKDAL
jgi:hypothetical protein